MKATFLSFLFIICAVQVSISQNFKFGKISEEELMEKTHPKEPEANAAVLYREFITNFEHSRELGFYTETEVYERIKIYTKEGFDWATKKVNLYQGSGNLNETISSLKAYTYYLNENNKIEEVKLRDNGIFEEEVNNYWKTTKFTMPDIREGCIIEYRYTKRSPYYTTMDTYRFQEIIPVNEVNLLYSSPEYFNYKVHQLGWYPYKINKDGRDRTMSYAFDRGIGSGSAMEVMNASKPERVDIKFRENIYTVQLYQVPALKEEPFSGNLDNYSASLKFELAYTKLPYSNLRSYSTTWGAVSNSIYQFSDFGGQLDKSSFFDDDIDALLAGVSNPNDKMLRIFEFVKNKMTCNNLNSIYAHSGVRSAYKEGKGNVAEINLMLTAMLRYAGLKADPILVSTKDNGIAIFPTRNGFNYVIAGVEIDDKVHILDATNKDGEVGILETKLLNWQGRLVREDGSSVWVPLTPATPAVQSTLLTVALSEDLSAEGSAQNRFTGHYSMKYRDAYKSVNDELKRKKIEESKGETEISNIEFKNLATLNQPVELKYDFKNFDAVENVEDKLYFSPMLFLQEKESPFKLEERKYPIDFNFSTKNRCLITISIPDGYTVESMPESTIFSLEQNMGSFSYSVTNTGNKIQVSVDFSMNEAVMLPESYEGLKKFYDMIIEKENEKVVLSKA